MKLNATQVQQTLNQTNAQVLPEDHPSARKLSELFGDHTFFVDEGGLKVLESTEPEAAEARMGSVVSLANWNDGKFSSLKPHDPAPTGAVIVLGQVETVTRRLAPFRHAAASIMCGSAISLG